MNDTQILDMMLRSIKIYAESNTPISPSVCGREIDWIEKMRKDQRKPPLDATVVEDAALPDWPHEGHPTVVKAETPFQNYWRCEHYPIAIENFFKGLEHCVIYGCPSYSVGNGLIHKDQVGDYYLQMTKDWKCDRCGDTRPHGHTL